ncbi:MAG: hypothetical protein AB1650_00155 [Candidatus Omnitrophota bacterium]
MAIKGILKEEYQNALRLQRRYKQELARLPKGSLVLKKIKGHQYYYSVYRNDQGKVSFDYLGKEISKEEIARMEAVKEKRAQYRKLLSQIDKEIRFLRKSIGGKGSI